MKYNVNNKVRVKLTEMGRAIHRSQHDDLIAQVPGLTMRYTPPKEDAEGWSEWQMWHLMETFGPHICMGCEPPFETEIDIVLPKENMNTNTTSLGEVQITAPALTLPAHLSVPFKSESDAIRALCLKVFGAEPSYEENTPKPGLGIMVHDLRREKAALVQRNIELQDVITAQKKEIASLKAELETERKRLADCGVVALADTEESRVEAIWT